MNPEDYLEGQEKPSKEQVAFIFASILDNADMGGSFRYLIYTKLGFSTDAYAILFSAGGQTINNILLTEKAHYE